MNNLRKLLPCPGWKHKGRGIMTEAGSMVIRAGAIPFLPQMLLAAETEKFRQRQRWRMTERERKK